MHGRKTAEATEKLNGVTGPMSRNPRRVYGAADRIRTGDVQLGKSISRHNLCHETRNLTAQTIFATRDDTRCPQRSQEMVTRMVTRRTRRGGSPGYGSISSTRLMRSPGFLGNPSACLVNPIRRPLEQRRLLCFS